MDSVTQKQEPSEEQAKVTGGVKSDAEALREDVETSAKPSIKATTGAATDTTAAKSTCKKHTDTSSRKKTTTLKKAHKREKQLSSSESDSSSSDSSSESSNDAGTESSSESDSSDTDDQKRKKKAKKAKAKAKKLKDKAKKAKSKKRRAAAEDNSSTSDEESSEDERAARKNARAKAKAKKQAKKHAETEDDSEDVEVEKDPRSAKLRHMRQRMAQLALDSASAQTTHRGRGGAGRRDVTWDESATKKKSKHATKTKTKKKRASNVAFKRVDQLWDQSIHNYKLTETVDDPDADEWDQYIFTVRRKFDWEHKYQDTQVDIRSKPLREALKHVMSDVKGVSLVQDTPHIDPNMLFLYLEESRAYREELKELIKTAKKKRERKSAATKAKHLKVLVKYLDKDYAETKKTLYPLLENKMITFDLLWALFKPNTVAYCSTYGDSDHPRAFKLDYATKDSHFMKGVWYSIEGRYLEYDGKSFGMGSCHVDVPSFTGSRKISSLDCYPIQYHKDPEGMRAKLIERGKKFVALKGMNYRVHKGMAYTKRKRQVLKININGRVMIDPAIHRRINPNYAISTVKPKEDQDIYVPSDEEDEESCQCGSSSDEGGGDDNTPSSSEESRQTRKRFKVVRDEEGQHHLIEIETDEQGDDIVQTDNLAALHGSAGDSFSDEELLIASPVVLGFAFSEKLWLEFTVSGISDVIWNSGAFDSLVLPDNQKSIVKALVSSHAFHPSRSIDDIISGKGKGLVAVLHGPPGTGKTLTAEGIADLLKCPLYMVSAGDLGTDPRTLEKELQNILDIAHSWGALLLLDEADVFLEKRSIHDIHRNALVSIFLRLLEYFQGILFLTTNRVETFDEAFVSRIHLSLRYGELNAKAKKTVWKMFIQRVREVEGMDVKQLSEQDYNDLAKRNINGRQIKNLTRAAQALAVHEGCALGMEHIKRVLEVAETFEVDLKGYVFPVSVCVTDLLT